MLSIAVSRNVKKAEHVPTLKAAIRLLSQIFTMAKDLPEFQRQVAMPNVPKFSLVLVGLVQNQTDQELKVRFS
jgi:rRNA processing/ribosome biogenesis